MMRSITAILRWGTGEWQTIMLECSHHVRMRRAEIKWQQLYVGKRIGCPECEAKP